MSDIESRAGVYINVKGPLFDPASPLDALAAPWIRSGGS